MANLLERIAFSENVTGRPRIPGHEFHYWMNLYALGLCTRGEFATRFDLQGDEVTQGNLIADEIDAQVNATNKSIYVQRIQTVLGLLNLTDSRYVVDEDAGTLDTAQIVNDLDL